MKRTILALILLFAFAGMGYAELNKGCFEQCFASSLSQNDSDKKYCEEKCSRAEEPYAKLQLDAQRESLELQKQQLELQKQTLEMQKQMLELQKSSQPQAAAPAEKVIEVGQE